MWCHSKCVGVIPSTASTFPFICPFCVKSVFSVLDSLNNTILNQAKEIPALKEEVDMLKNSFSDKLASITPSPVAITDNDSTLTPSYASAVEANRSSRDNATSNPTKVLDQNRKFNIVVFGVAEQSEGTSRFLRIKTTSSQYLLWFQTLSLTPITQALYVNVGVLVSMSIPRLGQF